MITALAGSYHLENSENFDEYLQELGVGFVMRKTMLRNIDPLTIEVEAEDDNFRITIKDQLGLQNRSFTLGQDYYYEPKFSTGGRCKCSADWDEESSTLVSNTIADDDGACYWAKDSTYSIEYIDEGILITMTAGSVTAKRTYRRER